MTWPSHLKTLTQADAMEDMFVSAVSETWTEINYNKLQLSLEGGDQSIQVYSRQIELNENQIGSHLCWCGLGCGLGCCYDQPCFHIKGRGRELMRDMSDYLLTNYKY